MNIHLKENNIRRINHFGKKQLSKITIIARFYSTKKRNEFMFGKIKLKNSKIYEKSFITKDLSSLRSRLLQYVKYVCVNEFVLYQSINEKVV